MKRTTISTKLLQTTILTTMLFTSSGCFFGFFEDEAKMPLMKPTINESSIIKEEPTIINNNNLITTTSTQNNSIFKRSQPISMGCTDQIDSPCKKELIKPEEITPLKVNTHVGGAIHKLRSLQGQNITIQERPTGYVFPNFKHKIVILEMFGKDCSHCIREMPTMRKLKRRYGKHLEIVAIQVEGKMSRHQANSLIRRHHITYPIIPGESAKNLQFHVQNTFGWTGILPFIMVIKDGVTEFTYSGTVSYNRIRKDIHSLLK